MMVGMDETLPPVQGVWRDNTYGRKTVENERQGQAGRMNQTTHWQQALSIGISSVDKEHMALIGVLDRLTESDEASTASDSVSELVTRLGTMLRAHFKHEEVFIRASAMPDVDKEAHMQRHNQILEQFVDLNMEAMGGRHRSLGELGALIKAWVVDHVVDYDLKLRDYPLGIASS